MALKAGYKGIKQVVLDALQQFVNKYSDSVVIKTVGEGLELTDAGVLNNISSGGGVDYSTDEQDTGLKYGDDVVYCKSFYADSAGSSASFGTIANIKQVIKIEGSYRYKTSSVEQWRVIPGASGVDFFPLINKADGSVSSYAQYNDRQFNVFFTVYYTKVSAEKNLVD